jgi:hypothetical protein
VPDVRLVPLAETHLGDVDELLRDSDVLRFTLRLCPRGRDAFDPSQAGIRVDATLWSRLPSDAA